MNLPARDDPPADDGDAARTGVPGFRTWRGVYAFVLGAFVLYVALLGVLTLAFR